MDYYDEDVRPRFQLQSSIPIPQEHQNNEIEKKHAAVCIAVGILLFSYGCLLHGIWQILLAWIGLSLAVGPFAPISITGGDIRVGLGGALDDPPDEYAKPDTERKNYKGKTRRSENNNNPEKLQSNGSRSNIIDAVEKPTEQTPEGNINGEVHSRVCANNQEWTPEEIELLRKQLAKNPAGKPGRWEIITEAFQGTRTQDNVIKKAKSFGEKKPADEDSYAKFLAQRKNLDRPVDSPLSERHNGDNLVAEELNLEAETNKVVKQGWSPTEDRALLNALKAFPKDTAMRWEKISAAVPGQSKAQCMKRLSELKQNFRSAKASDT